MLETTGKAQVEPGVTIKAVYLDRTLADEVGYTELSNDRFSRNFKRTYIGRNNIREEIMVTEQPSGHRSTFIPGPEQRLATNST